MHADQGNDWKIDELAQLSAMSRSKFANRFRDTLGFTPAVYLTNFRMATAEEMLGQGLTVKHIAKAVGYRSTSSFNTAFTNKHAVPPKQWSGTKPSDGDKVDDDGSHEDDES